MERKGDAQGEKSHNESEAIPGDTESNRMPGKEREAGEQIKGAPKKIYERGGIPHASRLCEGGGEWRALEPAQDVRETIAKKGAGKESGNVAHGRKHGLVKGAGIRDPVSIVFVSSGRRSICS
jgi:hypothetical protein